MSNSKSAVVVTGTVAAIGVVGSIIQLDDMIVEWLPWAAPYMEGIEFVFLATLLVMSVSTFAALVSMIRGLIEDGEFAEKGPLRRRLQHFRCEDMRADDLETVMGIYTQTTPGKTTIHVTRAIYGKCRIGWKKVVDVRTDELVGYFIVLPLTKLGEDAIRSRSFGFYDPQSADYFRKNHSTRCSAYIGMVGAKTGMKDARAFAVNRLRHFVNSGDYGRLYARAATSDGLRLLKKQSFIPVFPEDRAELDVMFMKTT
jgi:hypothetical protein